jgi:uncharacterized protein (TIGR03118 family)
LTLFLQTKDLGVTFRRTEQTTVAHPARESLLAPLNSRASHLVSPPIKEEERLMNSQRLTRTLLFLVLVAFAVAMLPSSAAAQYKITNLVSNVAGGAAHQDTSLVNAWGIAFSPTGPFWISDNGTGLSTLYTGKGIKQSLVVTVPPVSGTGLGRPTGMIFNTTVDFVVTQGTKSAPAAFIFDTEDGTISGWSPTVNATVAVIAATNSTAQYTGLALGANAGANFLFAADNHNNKVDIYDKTFKLVKSFTDTTLPAGSNPYNIQNIGGQLFVTFTTATGGGVVDIFDTTGTLVKTFTKSAKLKSPWGLALAPATFKVASNAILVGNLGDGKINYFNATTGAFKGQLKDTTGTVIVVPDLWGLAFGAGNAMNGKVNQLFLSSGPANYFNGLFSVIQ